MIGIGPGVGLRIGLGGQYVPTTVNMLGSVPYKGGGLYS